MIVGHMFDKFEDEVGCVANGPHKVARVGPCVLDSLLGAIVGARRGGALGSAQIPSITKNLNTTYFLLNLSDHVVAVHKPSLSQFVRIALHRNWKSAVTCAARAMSMSALAPRQTCCALSLVPDER